MKFKYILTSVLCGSFLLSGCMDKFAEINTDPSTISKPDVRFLFTKEVDNFRPSDYWAWFYDYSNMLKWGQVTVSGISNDENVNRPIEVSGGSNIYTIITIANEIDYRLSQMSAEEAASYKHIQAMARSLVVYMGIQNTDMYGSQPYSEAYKARYGGPLKPKYDTQEELFTEFLGELDEIVKVLSSDSYVVNGQAIKCTNLGSQDPIYNGDYKKWAKFANSLRLKLAARLYHHDSAKAIALAEKSANDPVGLILDKEDDFIHTIGSEWYGPNETPSTGTANKTLIDFLKDNRDPRLRFFFTKNQFNSRVIQAYYDAKAADPKQPDLPKFIENQVEFEIDENGHKKFKAWKAPGEPWVRYHGVPSLINSKDVKDDELQDLLDVSGIRHKITLNGIEGSYSSKSGIQLEMYKGNYSYKYPDAPGAPVREDKEKHQLHSSFLSAGEVNLYLAEFKLLGAKLASSPQEYFTNGIRNSVEGWNVVAGLNNIRYYDYAYDENETTIKLKEGEVDALLQKEAYKLTGDKTQDLEKVYIQQRLNFTFMPWEMYVTMRRSGVPKKESTIYPLEKWTTDGSYITLPRRFSFVDPAATDVMRDITLKALEEQGFTIGNEPELLNTERVWYDKNAPQFGEGPKLN